MTKEDLVAKAASLRDDLRAQGLPAHAKIADGLVDQLSGISEADPKAPPEWPAAAALVNLEKGIAFRLDFHRPGLAPGTVLCRITEAVLVRGVTVPAGTRRGSLSVDGQCIPEEAFRTRKGFEAFMGRTRASVFLACRLDPKGCADPDRPVGIFVTNGGQVSVQGEGAPDAALYGCGKATASG